MCNSEAKYTNNSNDDNIKLPHFLCLTKLLPKSAELHFTLMVKATRNEINGCFIIYYCPNRK